MPYQNNVYTGCPMKLLAKVAMIFAMLASIACSDKEKDSTADIARHQQSASTYLGQGQYKAAMLEVRNIIQLQPDSAQGYILLAKIYNQLGAASANYQLLEPVVKKLPDVATELADAYLIGKKYRSALNIIEQYPAASPENKIRQARIAALSSIYLGEKSEAEKYKENLKSADTGIADLAFVNATAALSQGLAEDATTALTEALQAEPNNTELLILLGSINLYTRKLDEAEQSLSKALGQLPKTDIITNQRLNALTLLTEVLIQLGRTSEAYTYQKIIAEANPDSNAAQQRFSEAMELFQQGKLADAESILRELREQFPNDKNTGTLLGMVEFQKGDTAKASSLFDEFIDPETANPTVLQAAALVKYRNNQFDDAIALLKSAAENQSNNSTVLATYGLALLDRDEKSQEGAMALEKSLALNPKQQRIRIALAKRYKALGQEGQAIAQLQKAYQEQPMDILIQQAYFKSLFDSDDVEKVKEEVDEFKQRNPDSPRGHFIEGWYLVELKKYQEAEKAFERAVSAPNNPEIQLAYSGLAQVYELQDQPQKAFTIWEAAIKADPTATAVYGRWFALARKLNRVSDAIDFLRKLEAETTAWQPSLVLSQLELVQNNIAKAIVHVELALQRSNEATNVKQIAARLFQAQGMMQRKNNQLADARVSYLRAVKLFPENADFLNNLISTEIADKNIPEAQKLLDQFVKTDENEAERLYLQANIRLAEGKADDALTLYRTAWGIKPMDPVAEAIYGHYQLQKDDGQIRAFAADWAEKLPQSYKASLVNAVYAQQNDNRPSAKRWYEKTVELAPQMPAALNNLAWMYYEDKDERALEFAKRAYELAPNNPAILDTYGWILVESGSVSEGIKFLELAAAGAPDNKEIQDHLKQALARQ